MIPARDYSLCSTEPSICFRSLQHVMPMVYRRSSVIPDRTSRTPSAPCSFSGFMKEFQCEKCCICLCENWENAFRYREDINLAWGDIVENSNR